MDTHTHTYSHTHTHTHTHTLTLTLTHTHTHTLTLTLTHTFLSLVEFLGHLMDGPVDNAIPTPSPLQRINLLKIGS